MSDNQNRSNMAEFIAGLSFASAAASNALSAANSPFSVASTITIRNRTKWTLKLHNVYLHAGFVKKPVAAIDPGYMEIMETHNTGHTACGTSGTVGYFVEGQGDQMFVVMWSVPYDHTLYSNWLAVGVRKGNHDEGNFNDMYSNSETWFKRGQFCKTIGTVESAGAGDCNTVKVTGTMGSTHKSDIVIDVWPVDSCNAAPRKN